MAEAEYKQEAWSLTDLFPSLGSKDLKTAQEQIEARLQGFEGSRSELSPDFTAEAFLEVLRDYERIVRDFSRLHAYGFLRFAEDTQDQQTQTFYAKVQQLAAEIENRTLFFKLWWKELDDEVADRLMEASGDYRYFLHALRLQRPYTLSEPEEKIINLKDVNGSRALYNLYDTITNRYVFRLEVAGEVRDLTREELTVHIQSPDPELREQAYKELFRVYEHDAPILGQIYQYRLRDWRSENLGVRGYNTPISVRNLANDLPDDVVDTLLEVCQRNAPLFQRYFELKARWLGMERLRRYDLYAPIAQTEVTYEFPQAVGMVLGSFREFDPGMADLASRVLEQRHLDSEVRKGKMGGAFCMTVNPDLTPWVLASYNGRPRDVSTLAHEIGHAVHSMLAEGHTALTQQATLPLAETASTFGEMLLIDRMLETEPDPDVRRDLLFLQMDDSYATIMRQSYFALFERRAHAMVHEGAAVDDLSAAYYETLQQQFGDAVELSEDFRSEWVAIPHFYGRPFYVYAYAFGQLLVLSLYKQYKEEGEAFKSRYLAILAAGGSDSPPRILERAGIDIREAAFWQGGFDVVGETLGMLEAIQIPDPSN